MSKIRTFIYLMPNNCISGYRICTENFIVDELQNIGCKILVVNHSYTNKVKELLKKNSFEGIIFSSLRIIWNHKRILKIAKKLGVKTYWWYFDSAMAKTKLTRKVNKVAPKVDIFFNKDYEEFSRYRKMDINPIWLDQGVSPVCNFVESDKYEFDLGFIGSISFDHMDRTKKLMKLDEQYDLAVYTSDGKDFNKMGFKNIFSPVSHSEFGEVVAKTKIMLSLNASSNKPFVWSNRIHLLLGSGAFCIADYVQGIEKSYTHEKDCIFFHNFDELFKLIDYWLKDDLKGEREKIRKQGFFTAHKKHSYNKRVNEFLNSLTLKYT